MALEHILHYKDITICTHLIGKLSFFNLRRTSTSVVESTKLQLMIIHIERYNKVTLRCWVFFLSSTITEVS